MGYMVHPNNGAQAEFNFTKKLKKNFIFYDVLSVLYL